MMTAVLTKYLPKSSVEMIRMVSFCCNKILSGYLHFLDAFKIF